MLAAEPRLGAAAAGVRPLAAGRDVAEGEAAGAGAALPALSGPLVSFIVLLDFGSAAGGGRRAGAAGGFADPRFWLTTRSTPTALSPPGVAAGPAGAGAASSLASGTLVEGRGSISGGAGICGMGVCATSRLGELLGNRLKALRWLPVHTSGMLGARACFLSPPPPTPRIARTVCHTLARANCGGRHL